MERRGRHSGGISLVECVCGADVVIDPTKMKRYPTYAGQSCPACHAEVRLRRSDLDRPVAKRRDVVDPLGWRRFVRR